MDLQEGAGREEVVPPARFQKKGSSKRNGVLFCVFLIRDNYIRMPSVPFKAS